MDPQDELLNLRTALTQSDRAQGVTVEWEPPTAAWRTARLILRRGDSEILVFEDLNELVYIPPNQSYPLPLPYVNADETAAALSQMLGQ